MVEETEGGFFFERPSRRPLFHFSSPGRDLGGPNMLRFSGGQCCIEGVFDTATRLLSQSKTCHVQGELFPLNLTLDVSKLE